jgi:hypothetical protein
MAIDPILHVFEVTAGTEKDLVRAETRDAAISKFEKITTIQGKKIDAKKAKAEYLYTIR